MDKIYILTLNSAVDTGYGEYVYLVGAFESELLATEAMKNIISKYPNSELSNDCFQLNLINVNHALDVKEIIGAYNKRYATDIFLGWYVE